MTSKILSLASAASLASLLAVAAFAPACTSSTSTADDGKGEATDELTAAFGLNNIQVVGSLAYGETSAATSYTKTPKYRAYKFAGSAGDKVDVWVKSTDGDTVAWILDNDWHTVAKNDDASSSDTNSHVTATLPKNASATHYIVVRDYYQSAMTFDVALTGGPADFSTGCNVDADCVAVDKACCANYGSIAVLGTEAAAYKASLACAAHTICPLFVLAPDFATAECNGSTHKCEMVKPADVKCGGFIAPSHQHKCPSGYSCSHVGVNPDVGGKCVQACGGIAGIACHDASQTCVDDPSDSCDPTKGGADCGGICQ